MFAKLTRTEGKGEVHINGQLVVAVYEAQEKTVIRTAAGGEGTSFVVTDRAEDVVKQLSTSGAKFVRLTRRKGGGPLFFNVAQVVGVFERTGTTVVRTTAGGEHAEHVVPESVSEIEVMLSEITAPQAPAASLINTLLKTPGARKAS